jgi:hypothetical protein
MSQDLLETNTSDPADHTPPTRLATPFLHVDGNAALLGEIDLDRLELNVGFNDLDLRLPLSFCYFLLRGAKSDGRM